VQVDRRLDDALAGVGLLLGAALEGVGPGHLISACIYVQPILTAALYFTIHKCITKLQ
jgi:hypothetical protein